MENHAPTALPSPANLAIIVRHAWRNSTFYRELYSAHGFNEASLQEAELHDLPIVTKDMAADHFDRLAADPRVTRAALERWLAENPSPSSRFLDEYLVIHSTGSTRLANFLYDRAAWRTISAAAGAYLFPAAAARPARLRSAFYIGRPGHHASHTAAANLSTAGVERLVISMFDPPEEALARLTAFQPDRLTTYSSSLAWLAELSLAGKLPIRPRDVVVSSDRLTPYVEQLAHDAWGARVYDLYAAAESLFMAVRAPGADEWKILENLARLEVLDDANRPVQPGQVGRVLLTNLYNPVLPLIRYDLTDRVTRGETRPGQATIRAFRGRTFDNLPIRLAGGAEGAIPCERLAEFAVPGLQGCQFLSLSPAEVEIHYRAQSNLDSAVEAAFARLLAESGAQIRFRARRVDQLPNDARTLKYKLVRYPQDEPLALPARLFSGAPLQPRAPVLQPGGGFTPLAREILDANLPACFERRARQSPDALAVSGGGERLTYAQLNRAANRVAHALLERGLQPGRPVALFFEHSPAMLPAMLGALKAGGCYLPLDPAHPPTRNRALLRDLAVERLLTAADLLPQARALAQAAGLPAACVLASDQLTSGDDANPGLAILPTAPACVLHTSGTTGQPRRVVLDQRAILHRVLTYVNDYQIGPADRLSLLQVYLFNASLREIFGALLCGASLHLYSLRREGVHRLAQWIQRERLSVLYMVPATLRAFFETLTDERFETVRLLRLGGEAVLPRDAQGFRRHFRAADDSTHAPGCVLANVLAASETGAICQAWFDHATPLDGACVPSGLPTLDKEISLVDEDGAPAADGETGELLVTSRFFGPPTLEDALAAPAGALPPLRSIATGDLGYRLPDGSLALVGRKSWLVKLRGQRVNLAEIEHALLALDDVAEAAVTAHSAADGAVTLAAAVRPRAWPAPPPAALRQSLRAVLPEVSIPAAIRFVESLPKTATGKIDRLALPAPQPDAAPPQPAAAPPATPAEAAVARVWSEVLGVDSPGVEESFFDLGGDSLRAARLIARLEQVFQRELSLALLVEHATIRALARDLTDANRLPLKEGLVTLQALGARAPVFFIPGIGGEVLALRDLVACLGAERPLYGLQGASTAAAREQPSIPQMAAHFIDQIRAVQPRPPYLLAGYSYGGHIALEIARRLRAEHPTGVLLILLDSLPPGPRPSAHWKDRLRIHLNNLRARATPRQFGDYLVERLRKLLLRWADLRPARAAAARITTPESASVNAAQIAMATYHPAAYPGKTVLFQAAGREWYVHWDPMAAWKEYLSGELQIRTLPGDHHSLIKPPNAAELARQLNQVFAEAEDLAH